MSYNACNPKAKALAAAKARSHIPWFILGVIAHVVTLAWAALATPRVPMAVDEESPTGRKDHETFEKTFQQHLKAERLRYAWMGTRIGGPLQLLVAVVTLANAVIDNAVFEPARFEREAPAEYAGATTAGSPGAQAAPTGAEPPRPDAGEPLSSDTVATAAAADEGAAAPTTDTGATTGADQRSETETPPVRMFDGRRVGDAEPGTTAELLEGYDCAPTDEAGWYDCTVRIDASGWRRPTGTWHGTYGRRGMARDLSVAIVFGDTISTQYANCSGVLTPTVENAEADERRVYRETLVEGTRRCIDNGLVTLKLAAGGRVLEFDWETGNGWRRRVWSGVLTQVAP